MHIASPTVQLLDTLVVHRECHKTCRGRRRQVQSVEPSTAFSFPLRHGELCDKVLGGMSEWPCGIHSFFYGNDSLTALTHTKYTNTQ
jgi:hypothetical protein